MSDNQSHRLPRYCVPRHYRLRLEPDLATATFAGRAEVEVTITEATDRLVLHALELEIHRAELTGAGKDTPWDGQVSYDPELQQAIIALPEPVAPGDYVLTCQFTGILNDQLHGFYRSVYTDEQGNQQVIATTQFEATDARRAFPCWDEPDFKATFGVTLVVPPGLAAFSNGAETGRHRLADGRVEVTFADTIKMSTYLVAFVVGPFIATPPVMVEGTPLRVITPQGKEHLTEYALACGEFCLKYLSDYYGIPYPGDKLDLVAIPDFAFGAMENLGCVTFRETALLVNQSTATRAELMRVLDVIGHELAHMWFGDLVTMKWWEGIWLNEAFATFMEMKATDACQPEWNRWLEFAAAERPWAFKVDDLANSRPVEFEVRLPEEAHAMFDGITYGKGSAVLRMVEQYIGEDAFRQGVGAYLRAHLYANTETRDLWEALDGACDQPVGEIMDTWILQAGFPRLAVSAGDGAVSLAQSRHLLIPNQGDHTLWKVPVQLRGEAAGKPFQVRVLLEEPSMEVPVGGPVDWVTANAGGHGFYRVWYEPTLAATLVGRLSMLDPVERFSLADDAWALVESGHAGAVSFMELATAFHSEIEAAVWGTILSGLGLISHHLVEDSSRPAYQEWVASLLAPALNSLGWTPQEEEPSTARILRGRLIAGLGRLAADPETAQRAREVYEQWLSLPESVDPEVASAALFVVAAHGDANAYEDFLARHKEAVDPQLEHKFLRAMTAMDDQQAVDRTFALIADGTIRSQDTTWVLGALLSNRLSGPYAWGHFMEKWPEMSDSVPPMTHSRMLSGLTALSEPGLATEVESFFTEHPLPHATKSLSQNLERLTAMVAMRGRETPAVAQRHGTGEG